MVPLETRHSNSHWGRRRDSGFQIVLHAVCLKHVSCHHRMGFVQLWCVHAICNVGEGNVLMGRRRRRLTCTDVCVNNRTAKTGYQRAEGTCGVTLRPRRKETTGASHSAFVLPYSWQWQKPRHCPFNTVQRVEWNWEKAPRTVPLSRWFTRALSILCHRVRFGRT